MVSFIKLHNKMNTWIFLSVILSVFGFLKEIRPSEPFIYEFLIGEWRNITDEQVNQQVYPYGTYSYLVLLVIVFLITDLSRYRPLILILALAGIVVWSMLLWTTSLLNLQIIQIYFLSVYFFTFIKELRPSQAFLYEFIIGQKNNVTNEVVIQEVYPTGTFSRTVFIIIVIIFSDLWLYKFGLMLYCLFGATVSGIYLWTNIDFLDLQIAQVFYGIFSACEVAYYTYIYANVDKEYYQQVTSYTRAAILAGRSISGIMGQLLISFKVMDYRQLNYITFGAMIAATIWCLFLPPVKKSIYFHQERSNQLSLPQKATNAFRLMWTHFKRAYSNKYTIKWSVWWALATCGFIQVQIYMQPLWTAIVDDPTQPVYNGAVEAVLTVLGFLGALFAGVLKVDWKTRGELALTCCSLLQGFIMLISSQSAYVLISYICYIVFGALYHLMITIASSEIAKHIDEDSYGLIFGINTFGALVCQTILTLIVVTSGIGFALPPRDQYFVYGIFHICIAVIYIIIGLTSWLASKRDYRRASTITNPAPPTIMAN